MVLRWSLGDTNKRMIRISYPKPNASHVEEKLNTTGRAEVYGIYFDFAKATIRPESEPVLKDIADVMAKNPSWKLSVEGHTDNIGGAAANQDLSTRRAAAVRQVLVDRYHVEPGRLTPAGFGASRPKDTNDTLEGRARNRRVELARQSGG
jgi:OOP family OmpA-OmpF porin